MSEDIVTITLSPCIDKSTEVDCFVPEKKLKCDYPIFEAGGGGINVSRALKNFSVDSRCIYIAGGYTGSILERLIFHEKLNGVPVFSEKFTRENFIVFEKQTHLQFRFGMPVNSISEKEWREVLKVLTSKSAKFVILSGSIHPKTPSVFFKGIAEYVLKKNAKLIVDTAGQPLKAIIKSGAFLIKPNQNEFSGLFGKETLTIKQICTKANEIVKKGKVENILVSLGANGALLVNKENTLHFLPPKLKIKSTVGAGDSMVAGIVLKLKEGQTLNDAIKFGVAAGSATTINSGMKLCSLNGAKKMMPRIMLGRLA